MAYSKVQRRAVAIAEHHPGKLYKRNRGLLSMTPDQMHDFSSTKEKGLPMRSKSHGKKKSTMSGY